MTLDHRFREAVEAFVARVRRDMDSHVQGLTSDLLRMGSENQEYWRSTLERAVTDARQDAERGFKARLEALRNELTREMEQRLSTERQQLQAATLAATQAAAEAANAVSAAHVASAQSAAHAATVVTAAAPRAAVPETGVREARREARIDTLERLLGAVRRLDEANSLTAILDTLAKGASEETSRVTILLVDGDLLKPWSSHGFAPGHAPTVIPIGSAGVLTATVALKQTSYVKPMIARDLTTPTFMQVPVGHTGLIVPLVVGGEVVAVLYADDVGQKEEHVDSPIWTEEIDLLVRHAALRLENLTSVRTTEALGS